VAQGSEAYVPQGERRGSGPTEEGTTGTGLDGMVAGAATVLTIYGLLVIAADVVLDSKLIPDNGLAVAGIMIGCLIVGGILGAIAAARSDR
jgi:hypothetical protein